LLTLIKIIQNLQSPLLAILIANRAEHYLSGLDAMACHMDMQKIPIIVLIENGLHWQFEVEMNSYKKLF